MPLKLKERMPLAFMHGLFIKKVFLEKAGKTQKGEAHTVLCGFLHAM